MPLPQEPPLAETDWETPLPDFLDETRQELYLCARKISSAFAVETNIIDLDFCGNTDWESVKIDGVRCVSNGQYAQRFAEFHLAY